MKIFRIAQDPNVEMLAQNPGKPNDPNVQLQNLQNAQGAIQYFGNVISIYEKIMADLIELEDTLNVGDTGLRVQMENTIKAAAQQTGAFNLLAQMNLISSIENILDQNELANVENLIITNISSISEQYSAQQRMNQ